MTRMLGRSSRPEIGGWLLGGSRKRALKNRIARRRETRGYVHLAAEYAAENSGLSQSSRRRTPPESWREDWDSPEDGVYDA